MTHIHYKFSSKLSYDTVVFDGPHITRGDLKRQIMSREKLRAGDCDLQITNAQTKEEYTDDEGLIPKGSSVIVRRIPIIGGKSGSSSKTNKTNLTKPQNGHTSVSFTDVTPLLYDFSLKLWREMRRAICIPSYKARPLFGLYKSLRAVPQVCSRTSFFI
uniref:DWNN domain-containing protein n=1 Tax=Kryptolebias marmoratus TaxID=37003 RepID=A0A3Q3GK61_KRYMA